MSSIPSLLGVSQKDFDLFITLSKSGPLPASNLAIRTGINRTTLFSALKRLQKKGLVYHIPKKSVTFFAAVDLENLISVAKERLRQEEEHVWQMSQFVAQLKKEQKHDSPVPQSAFFEGEEGIIALFKKMLIPNTSQEVFLTLEKIPPRILTYLKKGFTEEKKQKNVFSRVLIPESQRAKEYKSLDRKGNRETRFVPPHTAFETEIIISGSTLAMIDYRQHGMGVFIESTTLSTTLRATFELLWQNKVQK